jgi:hypothetical protein
MRGMRRITAPGTLLLIGVLAARCGDNGPNAGLAGAADVDQFAAGITQAFCAWQFRCCSAPELEALQQGRFDDEATCAQSGIAVAVTDQLLLVRTAVGEGLMTIDPVKAAACLEAYRNRPCNPIRPVNPDPYGMATTVAQTPNVNELLAVCPDLFTGLIHDGNRCEMTAECAAGSRCVGGSGAGGGPGYYDPYNPPPPPSTTTPVGGLGICARAQVANEPCNVSSDCDMAANLVCLAPDFLCGPPPGHLQRCNFTSSVMLNQNDLCDTSMHLTCDTNTLTCRKPPAEGDPCLSQGLPTNDCGSPTLVCVGFGIGTCRRPSARGEACGASAIPPCAAGLTCRPTQPDGIGVCGDPPGRGEACDSTGACASPFVCSYYGRCEAPGTKHFAENCTDNAQCASLSCQFVSESIRVCGPSQRSVYCSSNKVTPGNGTFIPPVPTGMGGFTGGTGAAGASGGTSAPPI